MQGTIKRILDHRGFGFINIEDQEDDIFFHRSQIDGTLVFEDLSEGTSVSFDIEDTVKGPKAINITAA
jgi:CspA family cold shock protein